MIESDLQHSKRGRAAWEQAENNSYNYLCVEKRGRRLSWCLSGESWILQRCIYSKERRRPHTPQFRAYLVKSRTMDHLHFPARPSRGFDVPARSKATRVTGQLPGGRNGYGDGSRAVVPCRSQRHQRRARFSRPGE